MMNSGAHQAKVTIVKIWLNLCDFGVSWQACKITSEYCETLDGITTIFDSSDYSEKTRSDRATKAPIQIFRVATVKYNPTKYISIPAIQSSLLRKVGSSARRRFRPEAPTNRP